jgi:Na+-translocating ferredoxin:NAD+ oxidoreductase RnfC subunit
MKSSRPELGYRFLAIYHVGGGVCERVCESEIEAARVFVCARKRERERERERRKESEREREREEERSDGEEEGQPAAG